MDGTGGWCRNIMGERLLGGGIKIEMTAKVCWGSVLFYFRMGVLVLQGALIENVWGCITGNMYYNRIRLNLSQQIGFRLFNINIYCPILHSGSTFVPKSWEVLPSEDRGAHKKLRELNCNLTSFDPDVFLPGDLKLTCRFRQFLQTASSSSQESGHY